jgi:hypothetical protein
MMALHQYAAVLVFALVASTGPAPAAFMDNAAPQPAASANPPSRTIEGVWYTLVTPSNCQTGNPVAPPLRGLFTFHEGGTMSEYGIGPGSSPALRSPGHGLWQRDHGWQQYTFRFTFYRYDGQGLFLGSQRVSGRLQLEASGDRLNTQSTVGIYDAAGNLVGTFCATAEASRFE